MSTSNKKITLVTALFNIGRGELDSGFKRSFDHYIECFKRLLHVDFPMVIYIEPENEHIVWEIRRKDNTRVIIKDKQSLYSFPFYNQVQKIRQNEEWINRSGWIRDSTQAALELYNPLVFQKQFYLNDASLFNFFDTKYFLWIDAGISNTVSIERYFENPNFEKNIIPYLNKMLYVCFPYDGKVEVHGFEKNKLNDYAGKETEYVARGGLFGGNKESINQINDIYYHLLNDTLNSGYMGTEESIFTIISYKYPNKCNIHMIEPNGLVYKFFEDVISSKTNQIPEYPLAFYFLTYNTPEQFEFSINEFKNAYPEEFQSSKKYVVDNSTDGVARISYKRIFSENNIEIIHEGLNLGIQDGRQLVAKHFDLSDHTYYIFFEEDFIMASKQDTKQNEKGFIRYVPNLFEKTIDILEENKLDFLRLTIIEFYGQCDHDWSYKNLPANKKEIYFPEREDGNEDLRWKTKIEYLGFHKDLAYAVGQFHYSNWPILFNKKGNKQVFLEVVYEHLYEQTLMSQAKMFMMEGKLHVGCLLAAPVYHHRFIHYDGKTRRENRHYTN